MSHLLKSYVMGQEAYNKISKNNYSCELVKDYDKNNELLTLYRNEGWVKIIFNKLKIIHENLKKHKYVCITDGDIVYENPNFLSYCLESIKDYDALFQNNTMSVSASPKRLLFCSGFVFLKSNERTLELYDLDNEDNFKILKKEKAEQPYLRTKIKEIDNFKLNFLPLQLYPNGKYYMHRVGKLNKKLKTNLIHFNYIKSDRKKKIMKKMNKWYLD